MANSDSFRLGREARFRKAFLFNCGRMAPQLCQVHVEFRDLSRLGIGSAEIRCKLLSGFAEAVFFEVADFITIIFHRHGQNAFPRRRGSSWDCFPTCPVRFMYVAILFRHSFFWGCAKKQAAATDSAPLARCTLLGASAADREVRQPRPDKFTSSCPNERALDHGKPIKA